MLQDLGREFRIGTGYTAARVIFAVREDRLDARLFTPWRGLLDR